MVDLDRKRSKVSKTLNYVCEYNRTDMPGKTLRTNHPQKKKFQPTTIFNGYHFYYKAKSSQTAVPRASTRCQFFRVSGWLLEK
jgi:hypothetical protein